jgi:hypothetical protein
LRFKGDGFSRKQTEISRDHRKADMRGGCFQYSKEMIFQKVARDWQGLLSNRDLKETTL